MGPIDVICDGNQFIPVTENINNNLINTEDSKYMKHMSKM